MHDAVQADFACQLSLSRLPSDAFPPPATPRYPHTATSRARPLAQRLLPSGAHGANVPCGHGAPWPCPGATLPLAFVWRQAGTGDWTAEIGHKTPPELKFQKQRRYRVEGFGFKNILEGR